MILRGKATEFIPYGALVLCRKREVSLAGPEIANGTARTQSGYCSVGREGYAIGEWVDADPVEGVGQRDLHAMANMPLMEPSRIYLPAGKLSEAEYRKRLRADFKRAGIEPS